MAIFQRKDLPLKISSSDRSGQRFLPGEHCNLHTTCGYWETVSPHALLIDFPHHLAHFFLLHSLPTSFLWGTYCGTRVIRRTQHCQPENSQLARNPAGSNESAGACPDLL